MKHIASHLRFSVLWFSFVFGIPVIGIVAAPFPAVAQATSPAEQPAIESPSEEAAHPPKTEAAEVEEHENDQYRHAPVVVSVSNMLHMSVESTARMFEIINILVLALDSHSSRPLPAQVPAQAF